MCISNLRETFHNYKWSPGFILISNYNVTLRCFTSSTPYNETGYGNCLMLTLC
jgi:hypothetical protein